MNKTSSLAKGFQSTSLPIYGEQSGPKTLDKRRWNKTVTFFFNSCAVSGAIYNIQRNKMQIDVTLITGILDQKYIFLIAI